MIEKEDYCEFCDGIAKPAKVKHTFERYGKKFEFKDIPALKCEKCGAAYLDGQATQDIERKMEEEVLSLASERFEVPKTYRYLKYYDEADLLFIRYGDADSVISHDDIDKGLLYDFDADGNLTGIEVWDFYGKYPENE